MKIVIDIDDEYVLADIKNRTFEPQSETDKIIIEALYNSTPLDEIVENIRNDMLDYHRVLYMDGNTKGACAVALCEYMVSKYFKGVSK